MSRQVLCASAGIFMSVATAGTAFAEGAERNLYWGDTHLHTNYSFDAFLFKNTKGDPDAAYRYAKGQPIVHPTLGQKIQIDTPLDFLVVADHAELTAVPKRIFEQDELLMRTQFGKRIGPLMAAGKGSEVFAEIVKLANAGSINSTETDELASVEIRMPAWVDIVDTADRHNDSGNFTAFIGWEWSSLPDAANLHRVVFMSQGADVAKQFLPYSSTVSVKPEDLWSWMEKTEAETGAEFVAIPHNMNISKGLMFPEQDSEGRPITAEYGRTRMRWEPVAEVTQFKGDSETHPILSPNDEFADYETYRHLIEMRPEAEHVASVTSGDYARGALRRGLEFEQSTGVNPYKFGMIGATDSHTGIPSAEEANFYNKFAYMNSPETRFATQDSALRAGALEMGAQGLAAVWAEENTRTSILAAFKRKEVYATTGPRMMVRFFGGWNFSSRDARTGGLAGLARRDKDASQTIGGRGYKKGVPMGGDLMQAPKGKAPSFLVQAIRDPKGANLDRVQMIKGWVDAEGVSHEKVYTIEASDGRVPDDDGNVPPVGSTVDLKTAQYENSIGASEFTTVWRDPDFDPALRAFYYVRVLEIPTPRHALYDAVALQKDLLEGIVSIIQERAYTSPIWYTP